MYSGHDHARQWKLNPWNGKDCLSVKIETFPLYGVDTTDFQSCLLVQTGLVAVSQGGTLYEKVVIQDAIEKFCILTVTVPMKSVISENTEWCLLLPHLQVSVISLSFIPINQLVQQKVKLGISSFKCSYGHGICLLLSCQALLFLVHLTFTDIVENTCLRVKTSNNVFFKWLSVELAFRQSCT